EILEVLPDQQGRFISVLENRFIFVWNLMQNDDQTTPSNSLSFLECCFDICRIPMSVSFFTTSPTSFTQMRLTSWCMDPDLPSHLYIGCSDGSVHLLSCPTANHGSSFSSRS